MAEVGVCLDLRALRTHRMSRYVVLVVYVADFSRMKVAHRVDQGYCCPGCTRFPVEDHISHNGLPRENVVQEHMLSCPEAGDSFAVGHSGRTATHGYSAQKVAVEDQIDAAAAQLHCTQYFAVVIAS